MHTIHWHYPSVLRFKGQLVLAAYGIQLLSDLATIIKITTSSLLAQRMTASPTKLTTRSPNVRFTYQMDHSHTECLLNGSPLHTLNRPLTHSFTHPQQQKHHDQLCTSIHVHKKRWGGMGQVPDQILYCFLYFFLANFFHA